jgi:hypothetical protein
MVLSSTARLSFMNGSQTHLPRVVVFKQKIEKLIKQGVTYCKNLIRRLFHKTGTMGKSLYS